jgi:hypothetical protein
MCSCCIKGILLRQVIIEILHNEGILLLYSALLGDMEDARILFNEIATNKIIMIDINKNNLLYF